MCFYPQSINTRLNNKTHQSESLSDGMMLHNIINTS